MPTVQARTSHQPSQGGEGATPAFCGFAPKTLLESGGVPVEALAELACREGQATSPLFRIHRWFARRLSSQFRGILAALSLPADARRQFWSRYFADIPLDGAVVLDPFVGGGTTLTEASRCGARVLGYDIDPVAASITRVELSLIGFDDLPPASERIVREVGTALAPFHRTILDDGREVTVLHHFWVEVRACPGCNTEVELHPHYRLAFDRVKGVQWVFCRACHAVHQRPLTATKFRCSCGITTRIEEAPVQDGSITCPSCRYSWGLSADRASAGPPTWYLFAQEYLEDGSKRPVRSFKRATDADRALVSRARAALAADEATRGTFAPTRAVPTECRADRRPLLYGFTTYRDFFNPRQLLHLTRLGRAIQAVEDEAARRVLGLAFSEHLTTNCMYTAYAFGYRRTSALFSIHGYRHITRPVEINPWLHRVGRGTFPNALEKIRRAIQYVRAPVTLDPKGGTRPSGRPIGTANGVASSPGPVLVAEREAAIVASSAAALEMLPAASVDLILTDPPYFDNVSYSELSDFYLAWHQALGIAPPPYTDSTRSAPIATSLAITKRNPEAVERYRTELAAILSECRRVLRPNGICVFTYHHESASAWSTVAYALASSGFRCTAVVPMRGEGQGGLHSHNGTIKWDAVLVCRPLDKLPAKSRTQHLSLVVSDRAIRAARRTVEKYRRQLDRNKRIGFRGPDKRNLLRALLAAAAANAATEAVRDGCTKMKPVDEALMAADRAC